MSKIFKLNTLSILPQDISISQGMVVSYLLPLFKLEIWLGDLLLDETHQVFLSNFKEHNHFFLQIKTKPFRYFPKELFNRSKVARLKIKLLRGNKNWSQEEQIQVFNIVLSEYSYQFCKNSYNEFRQHSLGISKKTFLYYKIQCEYQSVLEPRQLLPIEDKYEIRPLFKQFQQNKENNSHSFEINKSKNNSQMINQFLPTYLLPLNDSPSVNTSSVYIDMQAMKPVYRHESLQNRKLRIKIESSYLNADESNSQQDSVLKQHKNLIQSTSTFCNLFYYFYVLISIGIAIMQMSPSKKV